MNKTDLLTQTIYGFIYEYYRTDNDEVVYRGSSEHITKDGEANLQKVDDFHRKGNFFRLGKYAWTHFRLTLRRGLGPKVAIRQVTEPMEMSLFDLLLLEKNKIREKTLVGECYLNTHDDPLHAYLTIQCKMNGPTAKKFIKEVTELV